MYFNKYIDYIIRKFYSNARYTSSFFYTLKFFFEKNTKTLNVVAKLGNVYRSSKWVDLRMQNIKDSVLTRFLSLFLFFLFVILFYYLEIPFVTTIVSLISKVVLFIIDTVYYSWIMFVSFFYTSTLALRRNMCLYLVKTTLHAPTKSSISNIKGGKRTSTTDFTSYTVAKHTKHTNNLPLIFWNFYKAGESLTSLSHSFLTLSAISNKLSSFIKLTSQTSLAQFVALNLHRDLTCFNKRMSIETAPTTMPCIKDYESLFYGVALPASPNLFKLTYSFLPTQNSFSSVGVPTEKNLLLNTTINLTIARENRWLWKSNTFSNTLTLSLNNLSRTKKFINNPLLSSSVLNKNLWVSTKISDSRDMQVLNLLDSTQQSSAQLRTLRGGKAEYQNLNFVEDSLLWSLNRFANYQNMQLMQHAILDSGVMRKIAPLKTLSNSTNFYLANSDLSTSYNFILNRLYLPYATKNLPKNTTAIPTYLSTGIDFALLDYTTLNLIGVYFSSMSNQSQKLLYFSNL